MTDDKKGSGEKGKNGRNIEQMTDEKLSKVSGGGGCPPGGCDPELCLPCYPLCQPTCTPCCDPHQ